MTVNEKIYRYRTEKGMSQEALAEEIGVSRQSVSKWETGAALPDTEYVVKMAKLFGVSIDDLLLGGPLPEGEGEKKRRDAPPEKSENTLREKEETLCKRLSLWGFILSVAVCLVGLIVSIVAACRERKLGEVKQLTVAGITVGATLTAFLLQTLLLYLLYLVLASGR